MFAYASTTDPYSSVRNAHFHPEPTEYGWLMLGALLRLWRMKQPPLKRRKGKTGPKTPYPSINDWAALIGIDSGTLNSLELGRVENPGYLTMNAIVRASYVQVVLTDGKNFWTEPLTHGLFDAIVRERIPILDPDTNSQFTEEKLAQIGLFSGKKKSGLHLVGERLTSGESFTKGRSMSAKRIASLIQEWRSFPEHQGVEFESYLREQVMNVNLHLDPGSEPISLDRILAIIKGEPIQSTRDLWFLWTILRRPDESDLFSFDSVRQELGLPEDESASRPPVNNNH